MCYNQFVSLRRCELKSWMKNPLVRGRLCSSPCGDASWNHKVFRVLHNLHRSSPYGDVSWNVNTTNPSIPRFMFVSSLRRELKWKSKRRAATCGISFVSLRRRELKYLRITSNRSWTLFVSLRRRELKSVISCSISHVLCSSPYGDVSWNIT